MPLFKLYCLWFEVDFLCSTNISSLIVFGSFHSMFERTSSKAPLQANPCQNMLKTLFDTWPLYFIPNHLILREHMTFVFWNLLIMRQHKVWSIISFTIYVVYLNSLLGSIFYYLVFSFELCSRSTIVQYYSIVLFVSFSSPKNYFDVKEYQCLATFMW